MKLIVDAKNIQKSYGAQCVPKGVEFSFKLKKMKLWRSLEKTVLENQRF